MLHDLVQSFLRYTVSHEFTEVSITSIHACTIWIFRMSVYDFTFIAQFPTLNWIGLPADRMLSGYRKERKNNALAESIATFQSRQYARQ